MSLCFLLAAGEGRRLRPFTEHRPKPYLPLLGLPMAYYGVHLAKQAGFENFLMNKHHLPQWIDQLAQDLSVFTEKIETIDETQSLLGSGGAIWNARNILKDHDYFLIANGDEILIPQSEMVLSHVIDKFKHDDALCTLLTCDHPELLKTLKPVWVDENGDVKGFGMDKPSDDLRPVHYTGYKVFKREILDHLPDGESNIFYDVLVKSIQKGHRVSTYHMSSAKWYETGNFQGLITASQQLVENELPRINSLRESFKASAIQTLKFDDGTLCCLKDETIPEMDVKGFVFIDKNVRVGEDVLCENTVACPGAVLNKGQHYKDTFVFKN